jgi:putative aldouronate transport system permease protein
MFMIRRLKKEWPLYVLLIPGLIITAIFSYGPIYGLVMAFQNFSPAFGFWGSPWVGLDNFKTIFDNPQFIRALYNTLFISLMKITLRVLVPVIFALLLNEVRLTAMKRVFQTIIYIPNFISWVILAGIFMTILGSRGIVNTSLGFFGIGPVDFLTNPGNFPWTIIFTDVWRQFGFGTVVYLATIVSIDPGLYESAVIDGAGRWKQTVKITLPLMAPIIILMTVLALGNVLDAGFDQVFNMYNMSVLETGDIISTFVFRVGLEGGRFAIGTAVDLFNSVVSLILTIIALIVAYKVADYKVF